MYKVKYKVTYNGFVEKGQSLVISLVPQMLRSTSFFKNMKNCFMISNCAVLKLNGRTLI